MFIGHDGKKVDPAPLGAQRLVSEIHISLLRSEEVLLGHLFHKYLAPEWGED
jgi:hypothetical protein